MDQQARSTLAFLLATALACAPACERGRDEGGGAPPSGRDAAPDALRREGGPGAARPPADAAPAPVDGAAAPDPNVPASRAEEAVLDAVTAEAISPESAPPPPGPAARDAGAARPAKVADAGARVAADPVAPAAPTPAPAPTPAALPDGGDGAAQARRIAALVQGRYREARSFEADFEQTYRNRLMGRTQKSSGHVWLRPPDRMRWEYAPPSKNLIVADGRNLFVHEPEANQVVRMPVSGSELPAVMTFLTGGRDLAEDYHIRNVYEDELAERGQAGLELTPRRSSAVIARVVLVVDRTTGAVVRTILVDPEGNTNTFVWTNVRTDRPAPDSRFAFTPPEGARLVER